MAIDPSIAMSFRGLQLENPVNALVAIEGLRARQAENQMNALRLREQQRATQEGEAVRNYFAQAQGATDSPEFVQGLFRVSPNAAESYKKTLIEKQKAMTEEAARRMKMATDKLEMYQRALPGIQTPQQLAQWYAAQASDPDLAGTPVGQHSLEQKLASIPADPREFQQYLQKVALGLGKWLELNKPQLFNRDMGQTRDILAVPGLGGPAQVVQGSTARNTVDPNTSATLAQQRERLQFDRDQREEQRDPGRVASTSTDAAGNVSFFNSRGEKIRTEPAAGKPSAAFERNQQQRAQMKRDLDMVITELENASKDGGLIDKSTSSGLGALADKAKAFIPAAMGGGATEGSIAVSRMAPIADMVLKLVPRFEGPQSDKDTASYNKAAGEIANPNVPAAIKKAAAKEILRIYRARREQFIMRDAQGNLLPAENEVDFTNPLLR